ncbi:MAG: aldehyde dehydrogenase family protein [Thermoleophilia bacterium]|nr:aldehyde dehydrogenase family protein [Thermoleophilia bacterium]
MKTKEHRSTGTFSTGQDHPLFRSGNWFETGEWLEVRSPYDDSLAGRVAWAAPSEVSKAVADAARAMKEQPLEPFERADILADVARIIGERSEFLAQTITAESGKPISLARLEVSRAEATVVESAQVARQLVGEVVPIQGTAAGAGHSAFTMRVPVGVVAAITPFNFPLNLSVHKLAPAIAAGCAIVHKPADKTPLAAIALAECFEQAGLPGGWLNTILAEPVETSEILLSAREVGLVTFTGSAAVGWSIARAAERTRVVLELGNSTPIIVTSSADLDRAATLATQSSFNFAGQTCVSAQRVIVDQNIHDEFVEKLLGKVKALAVGDPWDQSTMVGPVINSDARDRIMDSIASSVEAGGELRCGGVEPTGNVIEPTVITGVAATAPLSCREIFGPVLAIISTSSFEQAIEIANGTDYGLQASVFTSRLDEAQRAAQALEFGSVLINESPSFRADAMPYGGVKSSGNSKEGPYYAVREMTEERLVVMAE